MGVDPYLQHKLMTGTILPAATPYGLQDIAFYFVPREVTGP